MGEQELKAVVSIGDPEKGAFLGGALGAFAFAMGPEPDLFLHKHEAEIVEDRVADLKRDIKSYENTKQAFDQASPELRTDTSKYLDSLIATKNDAIHAVTEHAPKYGFTQRAEMLGIGVGEMLGVGMLFAIGIHKARKVIANHAIRKQAQTSLSVPNQTNV